MAWEGEDFPWRIDLRDMQQLQSPGDCWRALLMGFAPCVSVSNVILFCVASGDL